MKTSAKFTKDGKTFWKCTCGGIHVAGRVQTAKAVNDIRSLTFGFLASDRVEPPFYVLRNQWQYDFYEKGIGLCIDDFGGGARLKSSDQGCYPEVFFSYETLVAEKVITQQEADLILERLKEFYGY